MAQFIAPYIIYFKPHFMIKLITILLFIAGKTLFLYYKLNQSTNKYIYNEHNL